MTRRQPPSQLGLVGLEPRRAEETLEPGAVVLRGFALDDERALLEALGEVQRAAPPTAMRTPSGLPMSVRTTSCGALGWWSDARGYRYERCEPRSGRPWPAMPPTFLALAQRAARQAGFEGYTPDSCLVNEYAPGARMSLHQDRDERDLVAPIVSVSLGLPAVFLWGGAERSARPRRVPLVHGDVVVWGGPARLRFHGVMPVAPGSHPELGARRVNLTFRRAGGDA